MRPPLNPSSGYSSRPARGSVLAVVLVMILFASLAIAVLMDRAGDDLLVETREIDAHRLRPDAYSALETVLAVLQDFRAVNGGLRSPSEGWEDPLGFCGYEPAGGLQVKVDFVDESGKLSLPRTTRESLVGLFKGWELSQGDSERLADALLHWMTPDYAPTSSFSPDYQLAELPYIAPGRSLRTWSELAVIDGVRDLFFDEEGRPNSLWKRFTSTFSLLDFTSTNLNAAGAGPLLSAGIDAPGQARLADYLSGSGMYQGRGASFLRSASDAAPILGRDAAPAGFGTEIQALRIIITVRDGRGFFRLNTVVTPRSGGARPVTKKATNKLLEEMEGKPGTPKLGPPSRDAAQKASGQGSINYPFAVLEIRENDELSRPPADPTAQP